MSYNIIEVLKEIAEKNGISNDNIVASVKNAISKTFSTLYPGQIIEVEMNENSLHVYQVLTVAEDDDNFDDYINITPEKAKGYSIGDTYKKEINLEKQPTDVVQSIMKNLRYGIVSSTNNNVYNK
jgi:predicted DNA binding protein